MTLGLATASLAGCSSGSDDTGAPPTVAPSTTAPPSATAVPTPEPTATTPETDSQAGNLTAENFAATVGAAMAAKGSVHMESTTVQGPVTTTVAANYVFSADNRPGGFSITLPIPPEGQLQAILVEGEGLFVNLGDETDNKYRPSGESDPLTAIVEPIVRMLNIDYNVQEIDGSISDFAVVGGPADVGGLPAQEYSVTVPTSVSVNQLGGDTLEALQGLIPELPESVEFHYWISSDNLPVKITYEVNGSTNETLLTQWGQIAPIAAPTADQLWDGPS